MKKASFLFLVLLFAACVCGAATTATRDMPFTYSSGGTFAVTIHVVPDTQSPPTGIIILETPPAGWTIISAQPAWDNQNVPPYKWLRFSGTGITQPYSISYTMQVAPDASGPYVLDGSIATSAGGGPLSGDTVIASTVDLNGDGNTDISDVILALRMAVGSDPQNPSLADVNGDGFVDIADVILIMRQSLGL